MILFGLLLIIALMGVCIRLSVQLTERFEAGPGLIPAFWIAISASTVAVGTELLSAFQVLGSGFIEFIWIGVLILGVVLSLKLRSPKDEIWAWVLPQDAFEKGIRSAIAFILLLTAMIALVSAPNNADALGYHNARVMHWLSHHSVAHYFTADHRQLRMPPLASYFRLHSYVLTRGDYFFNFTQWIGYFLSIFQGAALGWEMTQKRSAAFFSALMVATVPMAILQSMSSQNDLTAAAFLLASVLVLLKLRKQPSSALIVLFWTLMGLGALTKGTFYIYGAMVALISIPVHLQVFQKRTRSTGVAIAIGLVLALGLNLPHWVRNAKYFEGNAPQVEMVALRTWGEGAPWLPVKRAVDQLFRTAILQFDLIKKLPGAKSRIESGVTRFESSLGLSRYEPALRLSETANLNYFLEAPIPDEDYAGSTLHWLLAALALLWAVSSRDLRQNPSWRTVTIISLASGLALAIEVKWMPWNNRLLLPAVLLFSIPIAVIWSESIKFRNVIAILLVMFSLPYLFSAYSHPLIARAGEKAFFLRPRWSHYFQLNPGLQGSVEKILTQLPASCHQGLPVGLALGISPEYLFWEGSRQYGFNLVFESVPPGAKPETFCAQITECSEQGFCLKGS